MIMRRWVIWTLKGIGLRINHLTFAIEMDVKSFHSIHILLCDTNGHPVPSNVHLVPKTGSVGEEKIHTVIEMTLKKCDI